MPERRRERVLRVHYWNDCTFRSPTTTESWSPVQERLVLCPAVIRGHSVINATWRIGSSPARCSDLSVRRDSIRRMTRPLSAAVRPCPVTCES